MDWSKTKTIFIIVFSILNVSLYSLYVNRYNEAQQVEPLAAETTIEARLNDENITVKSLPPKKEKVSYISGQIKQFNIEELKKVYDNQYFDTNGSLLTSKFENPVPLKSIKDASSLTEFMKKNVYEGETYKLWYIDEEKREATFFQKFNDRMIYINQNAVVKLHWDRDFAVTGYKQTMFDSLAAFGEKSTLLTALEAIKVLYEKGFLKQDSKITKPQLGYSTLVPLTKTQVLAPTWHIHVDFVEGDEADYFVNAVDGQVINIHLNGEELKDNEWGRIRS